MSFSTTQIQFLQRLASERPANRHAGGVAKFFCDHYSLGAAVGRLIEYRDEHHRSAEALLLAHDLPVERLSQDANRAVVAAYGGVSEKSLSAAPHSRSMAVKCVAGCKLDGLELFTPPGCYMVVTPELAERIDCDRLLLVENLETFRRLEDYRWVDYGGLAVLAVFRGDPSLPVNHALDLVRRRVEPIWAFVDFDPAGLVIANALPHDRLERIVLPALQWLREAADTARGRQLFDDQAHSCARALEGSTHSLVKGWWQEMRALRSAVTQERMSLAARKAAG